MTTLLNRDVRLLSYGSIVAAWSGATGGTYVTSDLIAAETVWNASIVRRDLQGLLVGGTRGRGYDTELLLAGITVHLDEPSPDVQNVTRRQVAIARAIDVRAALDRAISHGLPQHNRTASQSAK